MISADRFSFHRGRQKPKKLFAEYAIMSADLIGSNYTLFQEAFDSTLAYFEQGLGFAGCINFQRVYFYHNLNCIKRCQRVSTPLEIAGARQAETLCFYGCFLSIVSKLC